MTKNYFYIILFFLTLSGYTSFAQDGKQGATDLNFYPNPVSNGKIFITSKSSQDKEITIFDVLGKKVLQTVVSTKELNIGNLSPGVYIIKIKEDDATATRKLIVK